MTKYFPLLFVLLAGLAQPFQAAMNAKMNKATGSPAWPVMMAFVPAAMLVLIAWATYVLPRGRGMGILESPWYVWLSGPIGILLIMSALIAVPISGAGLVIVVMVFGQAVASLVLDHNGWMGVKTVPISPWRVGGVLMILGGVLLMQKKSG